MTCGVVMVVASLWASAAVAETARAPSRHVSLLADGPGTGGATPSWGETEASREPALSPPPPPPVNDAPAIAPAPAPSRPSAVGPGERLPLIGEGRRCGTLAQPTCSLFWLPLASFLVPGLGQFVDDRPGWPYLLAGAAGFTGMVWLSTKVTPAELASETAYYNPKVQALLAVSEVWQTSAFLSIYETYRARMVDDLGLTTKHSPVSEVLVAPARLDRMARPSVFLPLLASVGLGIVGAQAQLNGRPAFTAYRPPDAAFTAGIAYAAGTGEEAVFRGFFMSYLEHRWGWYPWLANGAQAVAFGLAHGDVSPFGLGVRILLGGYLGWVTQANDYELIDAILIHTWWDVLQFTAAFAAATPADRPTLYLRLPPIPF